MSGYTVLVNPAAGDGSGPRTADLLAQTMRAGGARVTVESPAPDACVDLVVRAGERGDAVVVVGGDGMLSSVVGPAAASGVTLGLAPAGRGNDFVRMLGLPAAPSAVAEVLLSGVTNRIDLVGVTLPGRPERVVAGSAYAGLDARAGEIVDRVRWLPSRLQYPYAAIRAMATYRPARFRLVVDGVVHEHEAASLCLANSAYYGSGMKVAPDASVTDGELDAVIIGAASRRRLITSMPKVYDGSHTALDDVTVLRGRRFELTAEPASGGDLPIAGDGEPLGRVPRPGEEPAVVEVLPGALRVLTG